MDEIIEKDFFAVLADTAAGSLPEKIKLAKKIIENAKEGDASSLKMLEKALVDGRFNEEKKVQITDEQYKSIILLAAERIAAGNNKSVIPSA